MSEALDQVDDESASRRAQRVREPLADDTLRWLAGLPDDVRPEELPVRFPRIANALALRWFDGDLCRAYLEDVLIDRRGNRRGLPHVVAEELARLKNHVETVLYPVPQTVWDEVAGRSRGE